MKESDQANLIIQTLSRLKGGSKDLEGDSSQIGLKEIRMLIEHLKQIHS